MQLLRATRVIYRIALMLNAIQIPSALATCADLTIARVVIRTLTRVRSRIATRAAQIVTILSVLFLVGGKWKIQQYYQNHLNTDIQRVTAYITTSIQEHE